MTEVYNRSYYNVNNHSCFTFNNHGCNVQFMKFSERLKLARSYAGLTQQQLVEKLPLRSNGKPMMSQANLAKMEINEKTEGSNYSYYIAKACGINPEWLINEAGSMDFVEPTYKLNKEDLQILKVAQEMDTATKYQYIKIGSTLAEPKKLEGTNGGQ